MGTVNVITGATGLVGSHVAEQLCQRGEPVRALVRPRSDTQFLKTLPLELVVADLRELRHTPAALENAGTVYHCAAFVRDWGEWHEFYEGTVELTRRVVDACRNANAGRFVHVSSISVYGKPPDDGAEIAEETPIGQFLWRGDFYGCSKVQAEEVVREYDDHVIVRPSWIYGRRDRVSLPRLIQALRVRRARIIGRGDNLINMVSAADVARGIVAAGKAPAARDQAYNLCSRGEVTQRELFDLLSERLDLPRAGRRVPFCIAWRAAAMLELLFHTLGRKAPPPFTRRALLMLSRPTRFSITKSQRDLRWQPEVGVREGLEEAIQWQLKQEDASLKQPHVAAAQGHD